MITLQFVDGSGIADFAIKAFTWSKYDHVDLVLPDGRLLGAVPGAGVTIRNDEDIKGKKIRYSYNPSREAEKKLYELAHAQLGKPYDWFTIAGIVLHQDWKERDAWICSVMQLWLSDKINFPLLNTNTPVNRITPRDLLLSPYLNKV
jgi:hypothetical protein